MGRLSAALGLWGGRWDLCEEGAGSRRGGTVGVLEVAETPGEAGAASAKWRGLCQASRESCPRPAGPGNSLRTPGVPAISPWPTSPTSARLSLLLSALPLPSPLFLQPGFIPEYGGCVLQVVSAGMVVLRSSYGWLLGGSP